MAFSDPNLTDALDKYREHYGDEDAHKAMAYDAMVSHAQDQIAKQAEADKANAPITTARDALATAQAAQARAADLGIAGVAPSQATIDAAKAEEVANAARAADLAKHKATVAMPAASQPDPAAVTPATMELARDLTDEDYNTDGSLTATGMAKIQSAGPTQEAIDSAQKGFDQAGERVKHEQREIEGALDDQAVAAANEDEAAKTKLLTETARNAELAPLYKQAAQHEADYEIAVKQGYAAATEATNKQMARIRQSSDEAANAQIKNFWADKSTAGKIIGIISQAFAGAANGLSGQPGAPTPLDKIIDHDLELQRLNLNQKVTTSYREQGILGLMSKQYETQQAALAATRLASIAHVDALQKEISQKYNTPTAIAEYEKAHAQSLKNYAQVYAQAHGVILSSNLQQQTTASGILERAITSRSALEGRLAGQNGRIPNHIIGIKDPVNIQTMQQLAPFAQSIAVSVTANEKLLKLLEHPEPLNANWTQQVNNLASDTFAARRIDQKTGAKLEGKEAERVEVGVPSLKKNLLGMITPDSIYNFRKEVENNIQHDVEIYSSRARSLTKGAYDLNDPIIGKHLRRMATAVAPNG